MSLRDAADKFQAQKPGPACGLGALLGALSVEDREFFDQMVAERLPATDMSAILRSDGHDISSFTIRRHLRGECKCR